MKVEIILKGEKEININMAQDAVDAVDVMLKTIAKTYGIKNCYIITPLLRQQKLIHRIMEHWCHGYGSTYNESRKVALDIVKVKS